MSQRPERIPWGEPPPAPASAPSAAQPPVAARTESLAPPSRRDRQRVARELEHGALIALPTETVYGIAGRADQADTVARLRALKQREEEQALTWHIGDLEQLERFERVSPMARRLMRRYWPGPLTLVLPGVARGLELAATGGWTGVRFPAHRSTAKLLADLDFPVVATSANRRGEAPLSDADAVAKEFGEELALVLDGGPPRLKEASVVLRVGPGHFELLREGILDLEKLRQVAGLRIAFVCTGNTCRSPMAEGMARARLARRLGVPAERLSTFGFEIESMGLAAPVGAPVASHAVEVLSAEGVDIASHVSQPVLADGLAQLDRVYAMTQGHLDALREMLPPGRAKQCELLDPEGGDIPDPIGGSRADYDECAAQLRRLIDLRIDEWA